jgi:hypothetical protein
MHPSTPFHRLLIVLSLALALLLLGCEGILMPVSSNNELRSDRQGEFILSISPGNHTAYVGDGVRYSVSVIDRNGVEQPPGLQLWSVADGRVARIGSTGRLEALAAGSTRVSVATYGQQASVPLSVLVPGSTPGPTDADTSGGGPTTPPAVGPEPVFTAGVHQALWFDDFEASTGTASIYARYATQSAENGLHLDATGGRGSSKGLRIEWQPRAGCSDDSHFIEAGFPAAQEVVVQYAVRYQQGFVFDWIGRGGPCAGNAKKLFFLWAAAGSRFDFISENHFLGVGSDYDHPLFAQHLGTAVTPEVLGNGQWHRITLRVRQSSTPTATDGYIHGWIDGVQKWAVNNVASHASGGWVLFKLPTTFNQGSPIPQSEWMDDLRIWRP